MVAHSREYSFDADTRHLLDLMIHSLYTSKEIFLRELISNASDALDRCRFETLLNPDLYTEADKYEIRLEVDKGMRTLTVSDTGIGMSQSELISHIGTIAKSGTRELREQRGDEHPEQMTAELIGQFGVGFYSSFMVADKVTLVTRRAGAAAATLWESTGDGTYTLREAERASRGTSVTLHLKPLDPESGIEDFTDQWTLARIVKKYSDFIAYPVICEYEREVTESGPEPPRYITEDKILNSMRPIWTRPQSEVTESEYEEFYRHLSHDWTAPFQTIALKAEGTLEYQALLFIPSKAPQDLFYHAAESGLRLFAKRVMIVERCEGLLPRYLRFIKGVVDSEDLPLNISRQMLQQDRHISQIRKWLTKKVLDTLQDLSEKDPEKYFEFWDQFGRSLKEGVSSDYENKDRILSLLFFPSSDDPEKLTSLKAYVERMKEGQSEIYYLTGESRSIVENSPHLEAIRERNFEVLYLVEPVDELLVQCVSEYDGKKLKSAGKGSIKLANEAEEELKQKEGEVSGLLESLQKKLNEHVKQVRLSSRLVSSPACLVGTEMDYSPQLERLLQKGKGGGPKQRRVLELNPNHEIFATMCTRFENDNQDEALGEFAELLLGYAFLAEGTEIPDHTKFCRLLVSTMLKGLRE